MAAIASIPNLVDLALLAVLAEAIVLLAWRGRAARGLVTTLVAGGCVLLAWRLALAGLGWTWVAAAMSAALAFHLADVKRRLPPRR
jgi:hypothetical protein